MKFLNYHLSDWFQTCGVNWWRRSTDCRIEVGLGFIGGKREWISDNGLWVVEFHGKELEGFLDWFRKTSRTIYHEYELEQGKKNIDEFLTRSDFLKAFL